MQAYLKKVINRLASRTYQPLNRIEIDRNRLLGNVAYIQRQHPGFEIIPVLKGNAYGHGIAAVAEVLRGSSCKFLAVDGYFEANRIRRINGCQILVMGYVLPANVDMLDTKRCSFVVQDITGLLAFGALGRPVRIHLELNTGMNRLGLRADELPVYLDVLRGYPQLELEGVMTHLADADNEFDERYTVGQVAAFDRQVGDVLAAGFKPRFIHIAQTAGSPKVQSHYANAIRLGIGTYGINPLAEKDRSYGDMDELRPVLELKSRIIKVLELDEGDKVGYSCTFTASGPMRVGVLPLGYYEGVPRELSNIGCVTHNGTTLPIIGRVCMDHTVIDLKDSRLEVGDEVTVISKNTGDPNSIRGIQRDHEMFAYSVLTGLSSSVRREIV
jgi:alanine racemase